MKVRSVLPIVVLAGCLLLVGCKKTAAFLVIDAETKQPLTNTLIDHHRLFEFPDENAGEPYLDATLPVNKDGWAKIKKPKSTDTYTFRMAGYQGLLVRMTKPGEKAEYLVIGGQKKKQWFELELRESDDKKDVPTFIIPLKKG